MGLRVAQQRLSASPAASLHRLNHALGQTAETVSAWNVGLTSLSATLREDLEQGRGIGRRLREARHLCAAILPDWEARRLQGCSWLEEPAPSLAALPEALRQGCEVLRNDYQQMLRERRFLDREVVRAAEERGFLERRFGEIRLQPPAEEELALQLLGGLLGEEIPPAQLAEEARIREQLDHCLAEEVGMSHRLEDLELENVRLKNETARLVEQIVSQLRQLCTISSDVAELRRASLRRFRWAVQARAGVFNAVSQLAGSTLTLQNAISELRALPGLDALSAADACLTSLADCRSLCEALWQLHEAAGNSRWLRIYRRILQMELQNVAETVHDCSGVLIALQAGLKRVPASELLAGLTEYAAGNDSTLAHFALALCEWLSHPDCEKARAVCAILARLDPEGSSVTALMDFVDEHASECSTAFLDAIQQALPQSSRTVLLRAPRSSQAYEQALLRMGNELLKAFHNSPDRVE